MAKKRTSGEGYVKKQKNGSWRGQIMDGYRDDGKRNIVNFSAPRLEVIIIIVFQV